MRVSRWDFDAFLRDEAANEAIREARMALDALVPPLGGIQSHPDPQLALRAAHGRSTTGLEAVLDALQAPNK